MDSSQNDEAGPSNLAAAPPCAICNKPSIYTCPGCSTRTCSLVCSTAHKTTGQGCSGVRNQAAYVAMNKYGYMSLMDDYVFLENMGRKVGEWGREIVQGGYQNSGAAGRGRGGRGRGRGRGRGQGNVGARSSMWGYGVPNANGNPPKRDRLKIEMDERFIDMEMLPVGMERRTLNQSTWDQKASNVLLTIEFIVHAPRDPYAPSSQPPKPPFCFLTHRNRIDDSIFTCLQARILERNLSGKSKKDPPPEWLVNLILPDPNDPDSFVYPTCVMKTQIDPLASLQSRPAALRPGHIIRHGYYKLDPYRPLEEALKHKQFVEFPTIELWEEGGFNGPFVDDRGAVMRDEDNDRKPKRRKLGVREGKKAINGLLGGYGSDEDVEGVEEQNVLDLLANNYAGSDEDDGEGLGMPRFRDRLLLPSHLEDEDLSDEDAEGETDDELLEEENTEDLAVLLEKLREVGGLRNGGLAGNLDEDDQIDWGESGDEET